MQKYTTFGNVSEGRVFINKELLPRIASKLPDEDGKVLFVGCHKYWDYSPFFNNPGKLLEFKTLDKHPGGDDQPVPDYNLSIEDCKEIEDETFDLVVMVGVYEYLDHKKEAFSEIERILKKGGAALISVPGKGYYPDENRAMSPEDAFEKVKPLRVRELYVTYEQPPEVPPTAIHIVAEKLK